MTTDSVVPLARQHNRIADLSTVWVIADVYEYELPRLSLGQAATMTLSYWPGRSWTFCLPRSGSTRT